LDQLKAHAKNDTLKRRQTIIDQLSPSSTSSIGSIMVKENSTESIEKEEKRSKSDIFAETVGEISSLTTTFTKGKENRDSLIVLKMESEKKRTRMFGSKDRSMRMNNFVRLRSEGFYSFEDFRREIQSIIDST
jgi:hypothetical protein